MKNIHRTIKYEAELDPHFKEEIMGSQGGENLLECIQCGMCSGTCPLSIYMDFPPRRIIAMTREGFKREVLSSRTIWLCASCYSCSTHCPANIRITDIMYALKRYAIEEQIFPKKFPIPILARSFFEMVKRDGRSSEFWLVFGLWLKMSLKKLLLMAPLGWRLIRKRRLPIRTEAISNKKQLALIMHGLKEVA